MKKNFTLDLVGHVDFEGMVIDICFGDTTIASVNYDKGIENMEIEVFVKESGSLGTVFSLQDFIDILESAKKLAIRCAEEDKLIQWPWMDGPGTGEKGTPDVRDS